MSALRIEPTPGGVTLVTLVAAHALTPGVSRVPGEPDTLLFRNFHGNG